jgi:hypothetical protein
MEWRDGSDKDRGGCRKKSFWTAGAYDLRAAASAARANTVSPGPEARWLRFALSAYKQSAAKRLLLLFFQFVDDQGSDLANVLRRSSSKKIRWILSHKESRR